MLTYGIQLNRGKLVFYVDETLKKLLSLIGMKKIGIMENGRAAAAVIKEEIA